MIIFLSSVHFSVTIEPNNSLTLAIQISLPFLTYGIYDFFLDSGADVSLLVLWSLRFILKYAVLLGHLVYFSEIDQWPVVILCTVSCTDIANIDGSSRPLYRVEQCPWPTRQHLFTLLNATVECKNNSLSS